MVKKGKLRITITLDADHLMYIDHLRGAENQFFTRSEVISAIIDEYDLFTNGAWHKLVDK